VNPFLGINSWATEKFYNTVSGKLKGTVFLSANCCMKNFLVLAQNRWAINASEDDVIKCRICMQKNLINSYILPEVLSII
jgi:hypothetical protein